MPTVGVCAARDPHTGPIVHAPLATHKRSTWRSWCTWVAARQPCRSMLLVACLCLHFEGGLGYDICSRTRPRQTTSTPRTTSRVVHSLLKPREAARNAHIAPTTCFLCIGYATYHQTKRIEVPPCICAPTASDICAGVCLPPKCLSQPTDCLPPNGDARFRNATAFCRPRQPKRDRQGEHTLNKSISPSLPSPKPVCHLLWKGCAPANTTHDV